MRRNEVSIDDGPVTWNSFGGGPHHADRLPQTVEHSDQSSTECTIDVGIAHGPEEIARENDIGCREPHESIAIRVRGSDRNQLNILSIDVQRDRTIISHLGQRCRRCRNTTRWDE